jgi:hypothetical protein
LAQLPNVQLSFLKHPHELETFDGRVACFHRFKALNRVYQAFELAMISFDNIVQVFDLRVHGIRRTFPSASHSVTAGLKLAPCRY